jgi:hypothetical protein
METVILPAEIVGRLNNPTDEDKILIDEALQRMQTGERIFLADGSRKHIFFFVYLLFRGIEKLDEMNAYLYLETGYHRGMWFIAVLGEP